MKKVKAAIIGSGNIGTDLLIKIMRSNNVECSAFIGRNSMSVGLTKAREMGVNTSAEGINYLIKNPDICDIVFDATSAKTHLEHAKILEKLNKFAIDMTPAQVGKMCVPAVNLNECLQEKNVNLITCGGQATIPMAYAISQAQKGIEYIEVVSSIASRSAGPATRINLDEYIHTTEKGLQEFSGVQKTKAILNLNPAQPCINMQATIFAKIANPDLEKIKAAVCAMELKIKQYVPDYKVILNPTIENGRVATMIMVKGLGDYLPEYAGNLDIITCAAVEVAEAYARSIANKEK